MGKFDREEDTWDESICFRDLSVWLKVLVVLGWIGVVLNGAAFLVGFVGAMLGVL